MRPSWDEYFIKMAELVAERSTCLRRQVGAVAVRDNHILSTGYNGAPAGIEHCEKLGCMRRLLEVPSGERHELCNGVHAEQNVIIQASLHGVSLTDSTLYCTHSPCSICAKMLINAGVRRIVCKNYYADEMALTFLRHTNIDLEVL